MAREHEQLTHRLLVAGGLSELQLCDEVLTRAAARGLDLSVVHVDRLIGLVAFEQDWVVTWAQLRALGLGRGAIEHRVKRGLLLARHRGVYVWGAAARSERTAARAAVLACGPDAFVSHLSALALHGVAVAPRDIVDVTVLGRRVRCRGIRSHQTGAFHPADVRTLGGIRVVRPARALLDCAPTLTARELAGAVEQAQVKRLITRSQIIAAIERAPTRAGAAALRALVDQPGFTRSRAERIVRSLMRAADLPQPEFNADVDGSEVDALWRVQRVVLEFDSYEFHATRAAFERDRAKTAALTRGRYLVLRTTWTELTSRSHALVARTAEALALSAGAATGSPARGVP